MREQQMTTLAGPPLPVEFCHAGTWYAGSLVAWRHELDGSCAVRVQFVVGGLRRGSWLPLSDVRLRVHAHQPPVPRATPELTRI